MIIRKYDTREEWLDARLGRITGTRLKDLVVKRGSKPKIGFYEIIAERIAIPPSDENVMDRGLRLEEEAISRFIAETGKQVNTDLVIWHRDDDENIALSPDGYIEQDGKIAEAVECKCLSSARHIQAFMEKAVPDEYEHQVLQYFITNDDLKTLYFLFYDPRMPRDFFYITVHRVQVAEKVQEYLDLERETLTKLAEIEAIMTF